MTNNHPGVFTREWFSRTADMTTRQKKAVGILIVLVFVTVILVVYLLLTFENCWSLDLSFEDTPQVEWYYDHEGDGNVALVPIATHGSQSVRLGQPAQPALKFSTSRVYHEMVISDTQVRPVLSFWYRMCANDSIHLSDFRAYLITSTVGTSGEEPIPVEVITRDGYRTCDDRRPLACYDLQWRRASYDLTHLKGHTMTLVFETNDQDDERSLGIWTYVDYVQVVDAGRPAAGLYNSYLPMTMRLYSTCDLLDEGSICDCPSGHRVFSIPGQPAPTPTPRPTCPPTKTPTPS
jgi:hypothetical protein